MKRLVEIANLPEVTVCYQQQKGYKIQIKALSDYNKSLGHYKTLVKQLKAKTTSYCGDIQNLLVFKKNKAKKRSVIDYYTIILENLMEYFVEEAKKVTNVLEASYTQAKNFHKKIDKMITDSKKIMDQQIIYHEKLFKDYMINVYPETASFFFRLQGSDKKYIKRQDLSKQAALTQQYKAYEEVLNCEIDKINQSIRSMEDTFRDKTQNIKQAVVRWLESCSPEFAAELREQEMKSFAANIEPKDRKDRDRSRSKSKSRPRDLS